MPVRKEPLVAGEFYHIVNHSVSGKLFLNNNDYKRFLEATVYYKNVKPPVKFCIFNEATFKRRKEILAGLEKKKDFWVEIICYCLMPSHFHFLLKQVKDDGIFNFIRLLSTSYSRYFNTKYRRRGTFFQRRFQAVRIRTDEQLLHVSRYIHLNPYSSYLTKDLNQLLKYPYSSFREYLGKTKNFFCDKNIILGNFADIMSYEKFVFNQANYQKSLQDIKKEILE